VDDASERIDRQRVGAEKLGCGVLATAGLKRRCDQQPVAWAGFDLGGWSAVVMSLVYWALRRVLELVLLLLGRLGILPGEEVMP
jgi:hypothetical protein